MKATFEITSAGKRSILNVEGDLTAQSAEDFRSNLLNLLDISDTQDREVSLRKVTAIDASAIQLMYATQESLASDGKSLVIIGPEDAGVATLVMRTGFKKFLNF